MKKIKNKNTSKKDVQKMINEHQRLIDDRIKATDIINADSEEKRLNQESLLTNDFEESFTSNEPLRDIFSSKNIKFKTELSEEQRSAISILYDTYMEFLSKWNINITSLKNVLDQYVDFGASVGRKSRGEFVQAHQAWAQAQANAQMGKVGQADGLKTN